MTPWPEVNLRRLTKLGTGHTPSRQHPEYWENCTVPWLTLADVWQLRDGTKSRLDETSEKVSELGLANSAAVVHPAGTVAMSRTASVGFSCILDRDMATSQDFVTWTCGPLLDPRFLLHSLRGQRDRILGMRMGSTHQTIYMPDVERITTPLPPIAQQRAIADFLDTETARVYALIAKKLRLNDLLATRLRVRAGSLTRFGPRLPARRCLAGVRTGSTPNADSAHLIREAGDVEWFSPGDFKDGLSVDVSARNIERSAIDSRVVPAFPAHTVLIIGIGATAGRVAYLDREASGNQQVTCLIPNGLIRPRFLAWQLLAKVEEIRLTAPFTTLPILNNEFLRSLPVHVPTLREQDQRVAQLDSELARTARLQAQLAHQIDLLRELRRALITAAVMGEMEVPGVAA